jgi:hypothetical protein
MPRLLVSGGITSSRRFRIAVDLVRETMPNPMNSSGHTAEGAKKSHSITIRSYHHFSGRDPVEFWLTVPVRSVSVVFQ